MSRIPLPLKVLALVCALAALPVAVPGALASPAEDDLEQVEAKLAACKQELAQSRQAVHAANDFLNAVRKKRLVFFGGTVFGQFIPVRVDDYRDTLILEFVTGKITKRQLAQRLLDITDRFARTLRVLTDLRDEAREEVEKDLKRCAALAEQRDKLKSGGGGTKPPAQGAFPGGTATKMTFTIAGVSVTTDLKSNKQTGDPTLKAKSPTTLNGSVELNGTLPSGWTVVVFHNGTGDIRLISPTGGDFSLKAIHSSFDAFTRPSAYVCSTKVPPVCSPAAQASISIDWDP